MRRHGGRTGLADLLPKRWVDTLAPGGGKFGLGGPSSLGDELILTVVKLKALLRLASRSLLRVYAHNTSIGPLGRSPVWVSMELAKKRIGLTPL